MDEITKQTRVGTQDIIKFQLHNLNPTESAYVKFTKSIDRHICRSPVGRLGIKQVIKLFNWNRIKIQE